MNIDYNIYEGMEVKGMPEIVFSSGRIVVEDGEFKGKVGTGNFIRREAIEGVI